MKILLRHLIDLQEPALERFSVLSPHMKGKLLEFLLQDFLVASAKKSGRNYTNLS
jgi:hypothetical protein